MVEAFLIGLAIAITTGILGWLVRFALRSRGHADEIDQSINHLEATPVALGDLSTNLSEILHVVGAYLAGGVDSFGLSGLMIRAFHQRATPPQMTDLIAKLRLSGAVVSREKRSSPEMEPTEHYYLNDMGIRSVRRLAEQAAPDTVQRLDPALEPRAGTVTLTAPDAMDAVTVISMTAKVADEQSAPLGGTLVTLVVTDGQLVSNREFSGPGGEVEFTYISPATPGVVSATAVADSRVASVRMEVRARSR